MIRATAQGYAIVPAKNKGEVSRMNQINPRPPSEPLPHTEWASGHESPGSVCLSFPEHLVHDESPLDQAVITDLRRNNPGFFAETIHQFLRDGQIHFGTICHEVTNGDDQGLIRAALSFNESCGCIGANSLGNLCVWFEEEGRAGNVRHLVPVLPILEMEYFRTHMALEIELASLPIVSGMYKVVGSVTIPSPPHSI